MYFSLYNSQRCYVQGFYLNFEGHVKKWCETLSAASIHSLEHFIDDFLFDFDIYDYDRLWNEVNDLRMKSDESIEGF